MIREHTEEDCETIIDIWYAASLLATPFLSQAFLAEERDNIRSIWLPRAETWVFEQNGIVAGFLSLVGDEVGAIFVRPASQGDGIGRALMDHATTVRKDLFLDVFEENASGRRFYERYGFRVEGRHIHEPSGHMQLRLTYKPGEKSSAACHTPENA